MQNRYSPPSIWLKEVVENKIIGEIYMVQVNCYWNRDDRYYKNGGWKGTKNLDGGTLFTQFSHFIDIMYWLFGDIENIDGKFSDFNPLIIIFGNWLSSKTFFSFEFSILIWSTTFNAFDNI